MTTMGYIFFGLSVISAIAIPFVHIDAVEKVKNDKDTLINKIALGIFSGIIVWTILMMIRPTP